MAVTDRADRECLALIAANPNMTVPWFLMCSWLYYHADTSVISDEVFDALCRQALKHWKTIVHPHKKFIKVKDLRVGSGYAIPWRHLPLSIRSAAESLRRKYTEDYR